MYDPALNTWASKGNMNVGRYYHTAEHVVVSGGSERVLVIGGRGGVACYPCIPLNTAELYNPSTNSWAYTGNNMSAAREFHSSVVLGDGKVLVTGGEAAAPPKPNTEIYDPILNTWSIAASMSATRNAHTSVLLDDGRAFIVAGQNSSGKLAPTLFYDPSTNTWTTGPSLNNARTGHAMVKLSDGRVLVAGGTDNSGSPLYSAEIWDSTSNSWTTASPMSYRRYGHSMTLLADGRVLVAGGTGSLPGGTIGALSSAEIYDPSTDTWDSTDSMASARRYHSATLLNNGSVLISNGLGSSGNLATSEYYTLAP